MDNENRIYTDTQWNFAIGNSITDVYGKTTQVNDYVNWIGGKVVTKIPVGAIRCGTHEMNNWVDPSRTKITKEDLADANSMLFYISAPDCDGTEGESFQLNSITLHFDEPSEYAELAVRDIITPTDAEPTTSGDISVKPIPIGNKDANHSDFTRAYEINVKNASNTEAVVFKNTLTEYHRNALPFYNKNTAIFHMFAYSNVDSTFKLSAVDLNGAELSTTIVIPAVTTKLYTEVSASLKDAYDAAVAANPEFKFNLTDIRAIKVLPIVTGATTVKIAAPTLLTSAYVSSADDPEKQKKVNLINFDNCAPGTYGDNVELPSNLAIRGYEGTRRIVETADGSNALQVDFDKPLEVSGGELHQTSRRTNVTFDITIPAGSLEKIDYITFTLTYNGFPIAEQNTIEKQSVITMIANGDGVFVKQGQSAFPVSADKGQSLTWRLQVKNGFASSQSYYMTNWMDPASVIPTDDSHYRTMKTIHLYFAIPALDNEDIKKGMNMQLNSIDMVFTEPPLYNEEYTRLVNDGEARNIVSTNKNTITSTRIDLNSNNVNYRTFKKYYTIDAKKGNTAPVMVENALTKFMRNITPFVDTATFRMFYHAENATKVQISVINYKGEKLPFLVDLEKSKTAKFNEFEASFKEIYDEFIANGGVFDLTDIRGFEILPISTTAVKFDVSSPAIWSGAPGTGGSQGNFYYSLDDDSARIEAYDYNIHDGYEAIVEYLDIDATIAENGTRVPANTKILKIAKVTIKDDFGNLAQPAGKFWTSFKLPDGINHDNVRIAELFYDGSMLNVKRIVFDPNNYVSFKDIFASKILAILEVIPEEEEEVITPPEKEEEESIVPDNQNEEIIEEIIEEDKTQNEEVVENSSQTIIRHKRRKKNTVTESGFDSWLWIAIAAAAVAVVVVAGLVVFIIFRKKRNVKKGAQ